VLGVLGPVLYRVLILLPLLPKRLLTSRPRPQNQAIERRSGARFEQLRGFPTRRRTPSSRTLANPTDRRDQRLDLFSQNHASWSTHLTSDRLCVSRLLVPSVPFPSHLYPSPRFPPLSPLFSISSTRFVHGFLVSHEIDSEQWRS